jgi:hypothetical protein
MTTPAHRVGSQKKSTCNPFREWEYCQTPVKRKFIHINNGRPLVMCSCMHVFPHRTTSITCGSHATLLLISPPSLPATLVLVPRHRPASQPSLNIRTLHTHTAIHTHQHQRRKKRQLMLTHRPFLPPSLPSFLAACASRTPTKYADQTSNPPSKCCKGLWLNLVKFRK